MNCETFYLNLIYNRGNAYSNLNNYIKFNDGSGYFKLIRLLNNNESLRRLFGYNLLFSKNLGMSLFSRINLSDLPIEKLVFLSTAIIHSNVSKMSHFVRLKNEFEHNILIKEYDRAKEIIVTIYENFGMSLWLLDNASLLENLYRCEVPFKANFNKLEEQYFNVFNIKNNLKEKHDYYIKRMTDMRLSDVFLKYLLFVTVPTKQQEWKYIISSSYYFSVVDMYIFVDDYIRNNYNGANNPLILKSIDYFLDVKLNLDTEPLKRKKSSSCDIKKLIDAFEKNDFELVISNFFSHDFNCYSYIGAYKLTALSYLMSNTEVCESNSILSCKILRSIYFILKKEEPFFIQEINTIAIMVRILRTFQIHSGLSLFLKKYVNYDIGYNFDSQVVYDADYEYDQYEQNTKNIIMFPCQFKCCPKDEAYTKIFLTRYTTLIEKYPMAENYFKEAFVLARFDLLIEQGEFQQATALVVSSYVENKLLVFLLCTEAIVNNIKRKILDVDALTLEEVCYVFIDNSDFFVKERRNCFLDLFDNTGYDYPLDLIQKINTPKAVANFFLDYICNYEMLPKMYRLFKSTEEVEDYRLKICEYLLFREDYREKKRLMKEIEKTTKNRALLKRIKQVEKSRLTINTDSFKFNCFDQINEKIDMYNSTEKEVILLESKSNQMFVFRRTNQHNIILKDIYSLYCKEFCFGNHGLDISLSTRVRHGTLSNQLLKVFSDHNLSFDGHGNNQYFETLIKSNDINNSIRKECNTFSVNIQEILDYFTQHTLKVSFDFPIEGAVFRYDFDNVELAEFYDKFSVTNIITFDELIYLLNEFLIGKTNEYLKTIREVKLPQLLSDLTYEIDRLSINLHKHIANSGNSKIIDRMMIQCKTAIQNEVDLITQWFNLSEYNNWEDYSFKDLVKTCQEVEKNLFTGFSNISFSYAIPDTTFFKGDTFRYLIDVLLIILSNAVIHSGFKDNLEKLKIDFEVSCDSKYLYLGIKNNLSPKIDLTNLDQVINAINQSFFEKKYLIVNTRQEGGMGLYKIMHTLFAVLKIGRGFYVSRVDNSFRIEIQLAKEMLLNEKSFDCG